METTLGYGRGLLRGIARYARLHGPWAFYLTPGNLLQALPKWKNGAARASSPRRDSQVARRFWPLACRSLPWILSRTIGASQPPSHICEVCPDSHQAGRMAAEHLLAKGLSQFAFVGARAIRLGPRGVRRDSPTSCRGGVFLPGLFAPQSPRIASGVASNRAWSAGCNHCPRRSG